VENCRIVAEDRDAAALWDILEAARTIRDFTSEVSNNEYLADRKLQLAIERALEIIGEADVTGNVTGASGPRDRLRKTLTR
jgi:uncharacterized protein with HEPN domain